MTDRLEFRKIDGWTGNWRWNAATARFSDPLHGTLWKAQQQEITVGADTLVIRNHLTYLDGTTRDWTFDGALDGNPYPITWDDDGSVMTVIAFHQTGPLRGGDSFFAPDESFAGSEFFILREDGDNLKVWGSMTVGNDQHTYFEEWDRVA